MILVDRHLHGWAKDMGLDPENVNPASVDLTLGGHIIEHRAPSGEESDAWAKRLNGLAMTAAEASTCQRLALEAAEKTAYRLEPGEAFLFRPGYFYLAHSAEEIRMPKDFAALLTLKSTTGRRGLEHLNAGWIDPGFVGQITLEFTPMLPVLTRVGDRLVQLTFLQCAARPTRDYSLTGRYQGQKGATLPRLD